MISIENLDFSYHRKKEIFSKLTLTLPEGHVYGLLGLNGAGKTTLLKLISGLLFPRRGKMDVMGHIPARRLPAYLSEMFLITEEVTLPDLNMKTYARLIQPFYPRFDENLLSGTMEGFGVSLLDKLSTLSYGQRKKAWISLGIACNTRLLLMDEPTNGLDIPAKAYFRRLIASQLTAERCLVISTHQVRDLENLIDALIVLHQQEIVLRATTEEITDRLVFRPRQKGETALYAEETLRGDISVLPNLSHEQSCLDIELFFNAVLQNPEKMKMIFSS